MLSMTPAALPSQTAPYDPAPGAHIDYAVLREESARLLSEYLRINTTNLPGNELAAARWLQQTLAREGIEGRILDTAALGPGRANFYARLPGTGKGKAIALVHHMDIVPAKAAEWQVDPFSGAIRTARCGDEARWT
jgi:acetylornithine deacetylase/succinyl-diaminopimelate desuccinylase-like protein